MEGRSMNRRRFTLTAVGIAAAPAIVRAQNVVESSKHTLRLVTLGQGLEQPWGMTFLPGGRMLITERPGRLPVFANGRLEPTPLPGVPKVTATGQGGLLDVCLHPDFAQNRMLYLSYSGEGQGDDRRVSRSIPRPPRSGRSSTGCVAATSSTSSRPAPTTAGRRRPGENRPRRLDHRPLQKPARHGRSAAHPGAADLAQRAVLLHRDRVPGLESALFAGGLSACALFRIELNGGATPVRNG
jgi:glucose/arabinose dehydrogenase